MRIVTTIFYCFGAGSLLLAAAAGIFFALLHTVHVDLTVLNAPLLKSPTIIYDEAGIEWTRFWRDKREPLPFVALPMTVVQAFVAAEDHEFFTHNGFSLRGIARSVFFNTLYRRIVFGGSTITQQLVKLVFTNSERTVRRKVKEQLLAIDLERRYTKQQIMHAYLNNVYFGHGIYGIVAAASRFWNKDVSQLTIAQAATLASIVKSPERFCPLTSTQAVLRRRNYVIHMMHQLGMIDAITMQSAQAEELTLMPPAPCMAPHAHEYIRQWLESRYDKETIYGRGLRVYTTLNRALQEASQAAVQQGVVRIREQLAKPVDAGLVIVHATTGGISAMVGGAFYEHSQYNRAMQARRQLGSIFKPLVYAVALRQGHRMDEVDIDEPTTWHVGSRSWSPRNHDYKFQGPITLARALSVSNNIVTIKTLIKVGYEEVLQLGRALGLPMPLHGYPSLALGCIDVTVAQAAGCINALVQEGTYYEPYCISMVNDAWGNRLYTAHPVQQVVTTPQVTAQLRQVMMLGLRRYASLFKNSHIPTAACGKTGTNNDSRTCWFVGATPHYTTALYVGVDGNASMGKNVFATSTAFPIWLDIVNRVPDTGEFVLPEGVKYRRINWCTGEEDPRGLTIVVPSS